MSKAALHINHNHLFETAMNNGHQSFPKSAYGPAGYGRTLGSRLFSRVHKVVRHVVACDVGLSKSEKVRGYRHVPHVPIKPV